jgi:hypothetical protein
MSKKKDSFVTFEKKKINESRICKHIWKAQRREKYFVKCADGRENGYCIP